MSTVSTASQSQPLRARVAAAHEGPDANDFSQPLRARCLFVAAAAHEGPDANDLLLPKPANMRTALSTEWASIVHTSTSQIRSTIDLFYLNSDVVRPPEGLHKRFAFPTRFLTRAAFLTLMAFPQNALTQKIVELFVSPGEPGLNVLNFLHLIVLLDIKTLDVKLAFSFRVLASDLGGVWGLGREELSLLLSTTMTGNKLPLPASTLIFNCFLTCLCLVPQNPDSHCPRRTSVGFSTTPWRRAMRIARAASSSVNTSKW